MDKWIGQDIRLQDGRAKVTGAVRYTPDIQLHGLLYGRLVTSQMAHARIEAIDTAAAEALPGVVRVLTAADLPPIPPTQRHTLLLARERVIFTGQPVALVLAESEAAATDAAEQVMVDYAPLPAAATIDQALADDAPLVWPGGAPGASEAAAAHGTDLGDGGAQNGSPSNVTSRRKFRRGDVAQGFAQADVVVEATFNTPAVHQSSLETQGVVVQPDPAGQGVTVWSSTQAPFLVQEQVAETIGVPATEVRVAPMTVGGAFGAKFGLYEPLVALAARLTGRPVALVLTRMEENLAGVPALPARIRLKLGAREDGTLLALEGEAIFDAGVYPGTPAGFVCTVMANSYRIPHVALEGIEVLTHKVSNGAYRAPGAPQAFFALESLVDEVARRLQIDPLALRLQNVSRPGDKRIQGGEWPGMGNVEVLETLGQHPAWQQRDKARQAGRGVGIALGWWPGGTEPAAAVCQLARDGRLQLHLGSVDLNGTSTGFAILAAEVFGVSPEEVKVIRGDTSSAPYAGGAGGSKITYTVGPAVIAAAREARAQVLEIAAEEFEVDPADLEIADGAVQVRGVPDRSLSLADLAQKTMQFGGKYRPVLGHGRHAENRSAPAFCAQLAEVSVDEESGEVVVHRLVIVQDVGRAINPQGVRGQMMGGATQGLGWALYEDMAFDEAGQLLAATWMEYVVPHTSQAARKLETVIVEVPSEHGPLGARGVGEPPVIPTAAAVANAIADATGVRLVDLPMTPPRILAAISSS